jgi:CRISPR system Cascade subunit CasC
LIATVSPGAKKGSTAPYAFAETMLVESGVRQPRSLANAFRVPTAARVDSAEAALSEYLSRVDSAYGACEMRRHLALSKIELPGSQIGTLDALAEFAREEAGRVKVADKTAA